MSHKPFTVEKVLLLIFIAVCLILSVVLSMNSVTGYIIAEKVDSTLNFSALILFLSGLFGALIYLSKFR